VKRLTILLVIVAACGAKKDQPPASSAPAVDAHPAVAKTAIDAAPPHVATPLAKLYKHPTLRSQYIMTPGCERQHEDEAGATFTCPGSATTGRRTLVFGAAPESAADKPKDFDAIVAKLASADNAELILSDDDVGGGDLFIRRRGTLITVQCWAWVAPRIVSLEITPADDEQFADVVDQLSQICFDFVSANDPTPWPAK
jgi:hypothetical protein